MPAAGLLPVLELGNVGLCEHKKHSNLQSPFLPTGVLVGNQSLLCVALGFDDDLVGELPRTLRCSVLPGLSHYRNHEVASFSL